MTRTIHSPVTRTRPRRFGGFIAGSLVLGMIAAGSAWAGVTVTATGSSASAEISLAGGIEADLKLDFSSVSNLSVSSLGIDAQLVSVSDPALLARLPDVSLVTLSSAFPVLITVEPPAAGGLEFENTVSVQIHTENLVYSSGTRLRLFKAPLDGAFVDVTESVEPGSVRTRGRTGAFSQFLILLDLRTSTDVADGKYASLEARLADATSLATADRLELEARLDSSLAHYVQGDYVDAIAELDAFRARVAELSGLSIANVWRAGGSLSNVAGDLAGTAASLKFTLGVLRDGGS
ncbi:MAG TPA: DUF6689 family protein [Xanthomonadaceae bacterium]|nr:DUF6689 family protein [Xanthomonadaceae bacterium]